MNSDETWLLYLWSGTFGGAIAGMVAGVVAVLVLWRTNVHQTKLANAAMVEQRRLATEALIEQRRLAEAETAAAEARAARALENQREGLAQQLREQREEAAKGRRHAALGDLVAAVERGTNRYKSIPRIEECYEDMGSAIGRFTIDSDNRSLRIELTKWPYLMYSLLREANIESLVDEPDPRPYQRLVVASSTLNTFVPLWPNYSTEARAEILEDLTKIRVGCEKDSQSYRDGDHGNFEAGLEAVRKASGDS